MQAVVFFLSGAHLQGATYFIIVALITICVDFNVDAQFVQPSATLAILRARELDEDDSVCQLFLTSVVNICMYTTKGWHN